MKLALAKAVRKTTTTAKVAGAGAVAAAGVIKPSPNRTNATPPHKKKITRQAKTPLRAQKLAAKMMRINHAVVVVGASAEAAVVVAVMAKITPKISKLIKVKLIKVKAIRQKQARLKISHLHPKHPNIRQQ